VTLELTVEPASAAAPGNIELVPSAGKTSHLRGAGKGRFEIDFVPPLVAEKTTVEVAARITGGAKAAPLRIEVSPPTGDTGSRATGGPLDLRVPGRLVLGRDDSADVSIKPVEGLSLSLAVSTGSVTPLEKRGDGRLHATFRPPREKYPQVAIVVASLGIINTMVMSILERYREIGIMKAVGASDADVQKIFMFEAGTIGFLGGVLGLTLGWMVSGVINMVINAITSRQGVPAVDYFSFPWWLCFGAIVFSVLVSLLAGIYPTLRAARVDPVTALRHD